MEQPEGPKSPLLFILVPMLSTFAVQRLVLHHSSPDTHVYIAGYLVHHLFWGVLLQVPAAFLLAFGIRARWSRNFARAALGVGTAMILDEVIYLIATDASGTAYRSSVSLWGAIVVTTLAALLLLLIYFLAARHHTSPKNP